MGSLFVLPGMVWKEKRGVTGLKSAVISCVSGLVRSGDDDAGGVETCDLTYSTFNAVYVVI